MAKSLTLDSKLSDLCKFRMKWLAMFSRLAGSLVYRGGGSFSIFLAINLKQSRNLGVTKAEVCCITFVFKLIVEGARNYPNLVNYNQNNPTYWEPFRTPRIQI